VKREEIHGVVAELGWISGRRFQKAFQFDPSTLILRVHGGRLLCSVRRNAGAFHLLFEAVDGAYLYDSPFCGSINRHMGGSRIADVMLIEKGVAVLFERGERFIVDANRNNLVLLDPSGKTVSSLRGKGAGPEFGPDDGKGIPYSRTSMESLEVNRGLSERFFTEQHEKLKRSVSRVIRGELRKADRLVGKLEEEKEELDRRGEYKSKGELLKYNLSSVPKGRRSVRLRDYSGSEMDVELDPALDARANMERYFMLYRKLGRKTGKLSSRLEEVRDKRLLLEGLAGKISSIGLSISSPPEKIFRVLSGFGADEALLTRVRRSILPRQERKTGPAERSPFHTVTARSGKTILVGRSARDNDFLTVSHARGNDLWFHVEEGAGSHVVLRYEKNGEFLEQDIEDASLLALHFSRYRKSGAAVVYTRCKYVYKPRGAGPGRVIYHNNRMVEVRPDETLVRLLLDSKPPERGR